MKFFLFVLIAILLLAGYFGFDMYRRTSIAETLVADATRFSLNSEDTTRTMLVLGDSTGVGVGADTPDDSIAGLLSNKISATHVENYAVSGATVADIAAQAARAQLATYDVILVQIGANDIIRLRSATRIAEMLAPELETLSKKTDVLIHLSVGNVGAAPFFPFFMQPIYHTRTRAYHEAFTKRAAELDTIYVNLYEPPETDPFVAEPNVYLAADGLHPSSAGYALWFEKVKSILPGRFTDQS